MADERISEMPDGGALQATDQIPVRRPSGSPENVSILGSEFSGGSNPFGGATATANLIDTDIISLNSTPVQIVAAQGAGAVIVPRYFQLHMVPGTHPFGALWYSPYTILQLTYGNSGDNPIAITFINNPILDNQNEMFDVGLPNIEVSELENQGIYLYATADYNYGSIDTISVPTPNNSSGQVVNSYFVRPDGPGPQEFVIKITSVDTSGAITGATIVQRGNRALYNTSDVNSNFVSFGSLPAGKIIGVNQGTKTFTIEGDHVNDGRLIVNGNIDIISSDSNVGTYTISARNANGGDTDIVVVESIPSATVDGYIQNVSMFTYPIIGVDTGLNTVTIAGDHTSDPIAGVGFSWDILGSTGNDGLYNTASVALSGGNTVITIGFNSVSDSTADGYIVQDGGSGPSVNVDSIFLGDGQMNVKLWYEVLSTV